MSANVISHQEPRRKRADAGLLIVRRFGVVIVALAGVVVASWLATARQVADSVSTQPAALAPRLAEPAAAREPLLGGLEATADLTGATVPRSARRRTARRHSGVPLHAATTAEPAGYEILSAAELDGISQARE